MAAPFPPTDPGPVAPPPAEPRLTETLWEALRTLRANVLTLVGFVLVALTLGLALVVWIVPVVTGLFGHPLSILPYDPNALNSGAPYLPPGAQHWFGTDEDGRDLFSRVLVALPLDIGIAVLIVGAAVAIGGGLGLVSGFWESSIAARVVSSVILRVTDIFLAFPTLILALAVAALLGRNLNATLIALIVTWWPYYVRLVRGEVLTIKHQGYIPAARALGVREPTILFRHVLRNLLEPLVVYMTLDIGTVLVTFSTIAFIAIPLPPNEPEWGSMIFQYQGYLPQFLWMVLAPGIAIFLSVLSFSLLGDGLRDVLDPRTRRAFARVSTNIGTPTPSGSSPRPEA
jgi:peptide/nickel transport system permease protein